jgi:peptidylprolyl isomerase
MPAFALCPTAQARQGSAALLNSGGSTMLFRFAAALIAAFLLMPLSASAETLDPQNTIYMDIPAGLVVIKLLPDIAPNHVARVKELTRQGFYDGTPFHRVIPGFMAQGGDPTGTGTGGSKLPDLKAEFSNVPFTRGMIGAARTDDPNSANSQFFIMFGEAPNLNGQYTIWGQVVSGMEFVDKIKKGGGDDGMVDNPDRIVKMQLAADVKQ